MSGPSRPEPGSPVPEPASPASGVPEPEPGSPSRSAGPPAPQASPDLRGALRAATLRLADAGVPSPAADAALLAAHALRVEVSELHRRALLGAPAPDGLDALVAWRAQRVPLQHLTGHAHFRRLDLRVGPGVFVPRPETEVLVDLALRDLARPVSERDGDADDAGPLVVDLCTGSGAIALAIAQEHPGSRVVAVELAPPAADYAAANIARAALDVELRRGDAVEACPDLEGLVDLVASNPPYVPDDAVPIDPEVRDHDPAAALYGGPEGIELPLRIAGRAATLLRPGGVLLMEHGERQGDSLVAGLAADSRWSEVTDHVDLTGRPRVVRAVRAA